MSGGRIAIIGGGVIGLAIGWRLAQAGCSVAVFERGEVGQGASSAAAGMLAAGLEAEPGEQTLFGLCRRSQLRWPEFAAELTATTGLEVGLRTEGTLQIALTHDDAERLRFTAGYQRDLGVALDWLTPAQARRLEPHLGARLAGALFCAADHQVEPVRLVAALRAALLSAGAVLHEQAAIDGLVIEAGAVRGVRVGGTAHAADIVVLCAGAWSRAVPGLSAPPPVRPVKGQMLALQMPPYAPLLRHVVWTPQVYLVPRDDGRLVVGATVEERGFDAQPTAGGVLALLDGAWRAVPGVEELPLHKIWVGHRPGSRDDAPLLGPSGTDGLILATGHYRNGILLAPITADLIAGCVLDGGLAEWAAPFAATRFDRRQVAA
jgi:glycine oxidase